MSSKIITIALIAIALAVGFFVGKYEKSVPIGGLPNIADPFN